MRAGADRTALLALIGGPLTAIAALVYIAVCLVARGPAAPMALERLWSAAVLALAGVRVSVTGLERVTPGRSFVIMPNHRSWLDIPVLIRVAGRHDLRWVGKQEIRPVPFFGWAFAVSRHIAIDRGRRDRAIRAIRRAAASGGGGASIVLFPEGTRSATRDLLPFKKGGFHLAIETGLPILPVAIRGTEAVLPKRSWRVRSGGVDVRVLPAVEPPAGKDGLPRLTDEVRARLGGALETSNPRAEEV